jgi:hypothetical protein
MSKEYNDFQCIAERVTAVIDKPQVLGEGWSVQTWHFRKIGWWSGAICVAILALATMRFLRALQDVREDVRCAKNLKQIGAALQDYAQQHGSLPPAYITDKAGKPMLSWRVLILPHLGREDLYRQVRFDEPWDSPGNRRLARQIPDVYQCPVDSAANEGETSYLAVVGAQTAWPGVKGRQLRRLSRRYPGTILVVEAAGYGISWMEPRDMPFDDATVGVAKGRGKAGITCRHPCGGGDQSIKGVYEGKAVPVICRQWGANCLFDGGFALTVSETVPPKTLLELLTVKDE